MWQAALVLVAAAAAFAPLRPELVERVYSTFLYPGFQLRLTSISNLVPFALFDALILITLAAWLMAFAKDVRRSRGLHAGMIWTVARRTFVWAAAFYVVFLLAWGLNYRRVRLTAKLDYQSGAASQDSARALADAAVDQLNALHDPAHEAGWPQPDGIDPSLAGAFARAQGELGVRWRAATARPKATILDLYFRRAGVSAMTDPYFLETLVSRDLLPFERPFVVAHEWSHLAGFADEAEASFVGWLTCLRGSPADQYSGWLFLFDELIAVLQPPDRVLVVARLGPGPRADREAVGQRLRREVSPTASALGWRVYDRYLKANQVPAGIESYDEVVRLVLGVRFDPGWVPRLAGQSVR